MLEKPIFQRSKNILMAATKLFRHHNTLALVPCVICQAEIREFDRRYRRRKRQRNTGATVGYRKGSTRKLIILHNSFNYDELALDFQEKSF